MDGLSVGFSEGVIVGSENDSNVDIKDVVREGDSMLIVVGIADGALLLEGLVVEGLKDDNGDD